MRRLRSASMVTVVGAALASPSLLLAQELPPPIPPLLVPHPLPPPPPPAPSLLVQVHVDGSSDLSITRVTPLGWWTVCTGACDTPLPADGLYRVVGGSMVPSAPFTLRADPGQPETVRVHGASEPLFILGMIGVVGGGLVASYTWSAAAALATCVLGTGLQWTPGGSLGQGCMASTNGGVLAAFLVSGAIALVGTVLVATNAKTTVDQLFSSTAPAASPPSTPAAPPVPTDASRPTPSWKERSRELEKESPMMDLPVVQGRF